MPARLLSARLLRLSALAFATVVGLGLAAPSAARADELTAQNILDKALENGSIGFSKGSAVIEMLIEDEKGRAKERVIDVKAMKDDDGLKTLLKFQRPAEVAGMGFLVVEKDGSLPDQFLYMPAARVTRRVPATNAGGSLFGSDFAYADLMPLPAKDAEDVTSIRLADDKVSGRPTYVIQTDIPVTGSPYSRLVTYVDQTYLLPLRIDFFDADGKALKTLKVKELKKVDDRLLPTRLSMKNAQKGSSTEIRVRDIEPNAPLGPSDFTEEALQR